MRRETAKASQSRAWLKEGGREGGREDRREG
jgi:hypothetical protein